MGVTTIGGAQQQGGCVDRPGGQHHQVGAKQPAIAINLGLNGLHLVTTGIGMQLAHPGARANRDRRIGLGRGNTEQFGIAAGMALGFRPAQGQVVGADSLALKGGPQLFHHRLDRPGGQAIIRLASRLGGVHPSLAVDLEAPFSPVVIGGKIVIGQFPGGS